MKRLVAFIMLGLSAPCLAHEPTEGPPWDETENWKAVAFINDPQVDGGWPSGPGVLFYGLVEKVGTAATFETVKVYAKADKEYGADQVNEHYLVDCGTLKYRVTHIQPFAPKGMLPPPLVRAQDAPYAAPQPGSALRRVFNIVCAIDPRDATPVKDPYHFAKAQFARHPEMVPKAN
jgi:hypothetical protein